MKMDLIKNILEMKCTEKILTDIMIEKIKCMNSMNKDQKVHMKKKDILMKDKIIEEDLKVKKVSKEEIMMMIKEK